MQSELEGIGDAVEGSDNTTVLHYLVEIRLKS